ncbi:hypothetical protein [Naumannella huperziae]
MTTLTAAPIPPGRLGVPVEPAAMQRYLAALLTWSDDRRAELTALDEAVLAQPEPQRRALTRDVMLSLALWQAVRDRLDLLIATWDSGRVDAVRRERLSSLIWGRLDATLDPSLLVGDDEARPAGFAVSLPEACRLSDALAGQLRARLGHGPDASGLLTRLRQLRAQLDRIRDQVALEPEAGRPAAQAALTRLADRVAELQARAERGGDIGGMLGPAEIDAARLERDLIVGGAERRAAGALSEQARELRADLVARAAALRQLVDQTVRRVAPAPKYAVPDVTALGDPPAGRAELTAYLARLDQVSRALQVVQHAYSAALAEHTSLGGRLDVSQQRAAVVGLAGDRVLTGIAALTEEALAADPTPMVLARQLTDAYDTALAWRSGLTRRPEPPTKQSPQKQSPQKETAQ